MKLHTRLREVRKETNHLQEHVANALGVSREVIVNIEAGLRKVSAEDLIRLSGFYRMSLDELVYGEETEEIKKAFTCFFNKLSREDQNEVLYIMRVKSRKLR